MLMLLLVGLCPALAARFPDAVEKKIVLVGGESASVAELFGFNGSQSASVSLPLGRMDAWAVYLLKKDTKVELTNDNEGSPPRLDVLEFSNTPIPSLTIQPYWLDLATRHPSPSVGFYSFSSPFISQELDQSDPWTQLVKRLKKQAQWDNGARTQYRRSFSFSNGASLAIEVFAEEDYANDKHGHSVRITVRPEGA
jgi:hypothetical protein